MFAREVIAFLALPGVVWCEYDFYVAGKGTLAPGRHRGNW